MVGARPKHTPDSRHPPPNQREHVSVREIPSTTEDNIVSPISTGHILGEGAAIFTDMTETMLTALDQQMALSGEAQKPEGSLMSNTLISGQISSQSNAGESRAIPRSTDKIEDQNPDLYLLVAEYYKISNRFYGYMDSVSMDNYPMKLVKLIRLSYRYGATVCAVDRVNGTMYGKFSVSYRVISKRATRKPQYRDASLEGEDVPMHPMSVNTLPGTTQMVTPLAKSTPITQSLQMPTTSDTLLPIRDILEPASTEQVRSTYLESQMRQMDSVKLPSGMPFLKDGMVPRPESLQDRKQNFC